MTVNRVQQAQLVLGGTIDPAQGVTQLALFDQDGTVVDFTGLKQAAHVAPVSAPAATDLATAITLANANKTTINALIAALIAAGEEA